MALVVRLLISLLSSLSAFTATAEDQGRINSVAAISADQSGGLTVLWGVADEATVVGQLFRFQIPLEAFQGPVDNYDVTEAGFPSLPKWLSWNEQTSELYGVAMGSDLGSHFIEVAAKRKLNNTHFAVAKDIFSLNVISETSLTAQLAAHHHQDPSGGDQLEFYRLADLNCHKDQPLMGVRLSIGVPRVAKMEDLRPTLLRDLIQMVAAELVVPVEQLRLWGEEDLPADLSILSASAGRDSSISAHQSFVKLYIAYRIGCGSTVSPNAAQLIRHAEEVAGSGFTSNEWNLLLWRLDVISLTFGPRRRYRVVGYSTPTPVVHQTVPTATVDWRSTSETSASTRPTARPSSSRRTKPTQARTSRPTTVRPTTTTFSTDDWTYERTPELTITTRRFPVEESKVVTSAINNTKPRRLSEIDEIICTKGLYCSHPIDKDLFRDEEDGDAHQLRLVLTALNDRMEKSHSSGGWLAYNVDQRILEGVSMTSDKFQFRLAAYDSHNATDAGAFEVNVVSNKDVVDRLTHSFKVELRDTNQLAHNSSQLLQFTKWIAKFFRDPTPSYVALLDVQKSSISWANTTLLSDKVCPKKDIDRVSRALSKNGKLLHSNLTSYLRSSTLRSSVTDRFSAAPLGLCAISTGPPHVGSTDTTATTNGTVGISILADDAGKENPFVATVLPIVIIVFLLVVAAIIACLLYRRNRDRKGMRSADGKNEFVSKGVPIILPDEIEPSQGEPTAASPMLLKDEKPPASFLGGAKGPSIAPGSTRGDPDGGETASGVRKSITPDGIGEDLELSERGRLMDTSGDGFLSAQSNAATRGGTAPREIYRPPPPFETSTASPKPRPTHQNPQQRQPPPYVPP